VVGERGGSKRRQGSLIRLVWAAGTGYDGLDTMSAVRRHEFAKG